MEQPQPTYPEGRQLSHFEALSLGLKVLFSEIHWHIIRGLRSWEIRQMHHRLNKEYKRLGQLLSSREGASGSEEEDVQGEIDLCRKQIDFLKGEVDYLQSELNELRRSSIEKRRRKWCI
jgi:hypothetical protein